MLRLTESVDAGKAAAAAAGGMCDVVAQGPICVEGGKKVLTADAASHSLLAHFTFDDAYGLPIRVSELRGLPMRVFDNRSINAA